MAARIHHAHRRKWHRIPSVKRSVALEPIQEKIERLAKQRVGAALDKAISELERVQDQRMTKYEMSVKIAQQVGVGPVVAKQIVQATLGATLAASLSSL